MNKETEDALHMLLHCSLKDTEYETQFEQYKIVRDYITNLQQENKRLTEELKNKPDVLDVTRYLDIIREYLKEIDRLQQKIDKALKYIDEFSGYYADDDGTAMFVIEELKEETFVKDILEILGDKENE